MGEDGAHRTGGTGACGKVTTTGYHHWRPRSVVVSGDVTCTGCSWSGPPGRLRDHLAGCVSRVPCPTCHMAGWVRCVNVEGDVLGRPHRSRVRLFDAVRDDLSDVFHTVESEVLMVAVGEWLRDWKVRDAVRLVLRFGPDMEAEWRSLLVADLQACAGVMRSQPHRALRPGVVGEDAREDLCGLDDAVDWLSWTLHDSTGDGDGRWGRTEVWCPGCQWSGPPNLLSEHLSGCASRVPCPTCHTGPWSSCVNHHGGPSSTLHRDRVRLAAGVETTRPGRFHDVTSDVIVAAAVPVFQQAGTPQGVMFVQEHAPRMGEVARTKLVGVLRSHVLLPYRMVTPAQWTPEAKVLAESVSDLVAWVESF